MILMLDPQASDEQRDKIAGDVKSKLESAGEILHEANWGLRKMAYEIEKRESSDYRFYRFNGDKALLDDLDHSLKITEGVLRFRVFKTEPEAPVMVPPDVEQIMRRDEDDRGRGRDRDGGGRGGPRRPRYEEEGSSSDSAPTETAAPAPAAPEPVAEAAEPVAASTPEPAAEPAPEPAPEPAAAAAAPADSE